MATPLAVFGPGILILTRTDVTPNTPINVGYVQEFSIEMSGTTKQLYGQNQFPLAAARGTVKATGKFKAATVSATAMNTAFYGMAGFTSTGTGIAWTIGSTFTSNSTGGTGSFQVGSSLTFDADLGVTGSTTSLPYYRVSTGNEVSGRSYSVTATAPGQYNFADQGANLKITYTSLTGAGQSLLVSNQSIGRTPTFQVDYYTNFNQPTAKPFVVRLFSAIASKHAMMFKLEDFMIPEWDFDLFANASGNVFTAVFPEFT